MAARSLVYMRGPGDCSPPFESAGVPASTRSLLLVCDDPDAPREDFPTLGRVQYLSTLEEPQRGLWRGNIGEGSSTGDQRFRKAADTAALSPAGDKPHACHFGLSVLRDVIDDAGPGATCEEIKRLASPYEIECCELLGFFGRKMKGH